MSRAGLAWAGLAATAQVVAAVSVSLGWIGGFSVEQATGLSRQLEEWNYRLDLGITSIDLDPTIVSQLDPGGYMSITGSSLGGLGQWLTILIVGGVLLSAVAAWAARPMLQIAVALSLATLTTLIGIFLVFVEWLDLQKIPFVDRLPNEVFQYLPNVHAGGGLWLCVVALAFASVASSASVVSCYRARYGVRWALVMERFELRSQS